jgi:hypothetical protein
VPMNSSDNILNELVSISLEVARISRQLPYEAPAGYFEGLAAQVMERIKAEEVALPAVLQGVKENPFTVPAGYFEHFAQQVLARVKAGDEEMPPVLDGKPVNPYTVPVGYFDQLPEAILQRVKADEAATAQEELSVLSPLLSGLSRKMPFQAPEGYFADLTDNVVSGAKAIEFVNEELENLSPVMAGLKAKQTYEVPAGYFDQLPGQLLNKVKGAQQQPAKVVSMSFASKLIRYATAAVLVGAVALGAWWLVTPSVKTVTPAGPQIAQSSVGLDKVSDDELQDYLEDETASLPAEVLAMNTKTEIGANDMKDMLVDVSDEEIQKYLETNTIVKLNKTSTN